MAFGRQKVGLYNYFGPNGQSHSRCNIFDECAEGAISMNGTKMRFDECDFPWNGDMTKKHTLQKVMSSCVLSKLFCQKVNIPAFDFAHWPTCQAPCGPLVVSKDNFA